ncbi:hypothetical protein A7A08_01687 [Methyloligella halotolerans]|uniref:Uncharacterized protein n=1 Tax=Methyloligella halotolerans TaxID=1177755 RepID=A0A1E2RZS3_9HYPH|nr:hypothetical protein [Methyloligella halotolerans]ODA67652.1 hypothetical protein A7A08_01687 [Methyloligella halotolerans]
MTRALLITDGEEALPVLLPGETLRDIREEASYRRVPPELLIAQILADAAREDRFPDRGCGR